jgi:branched-chain amino acid transport system permease protein
MSTTAVYFLTNVALFILLGWTLYVSFRNGQLNMGCVYTMGISAYTVTIAYMKWGWPLAPAMILAIALGTVSAFLPSLFLAQVPPFTLVIATLGLIGITQAVFLNIPYFGAAYGIVNIPSLSSALAISWIAVIVMGFFIYRLDHSRFGRSMEMVAIDPDLAATMGVDSRRGGIFLQTFSGLLSSIAGTLYPFITNAVYPRNFGFTILLRICCFFFVGGPNTMWGVAVFTPILWAVSVFLPPAIAAWKDVIYGVLMVGIIVARPEGAIDKPLLRAIGNKIRQLRGLKPVGAPA